MKKYLYNFLVSALILLPVFYLQISVSYAFEATSTSFEVHAGAIETVSATGTSATYKNTSAGGQIATGIITNVRKIYSGILYWLFVSNVAQYNQIHFRWRNDDGNESAATWAAAEDTQLGSIPINTIKRLRLEISNTGWTRGVAPSFRLEYRQMFPCGVGTYTVIPTDYSQHWHIATSSNITDAEATTDVLGGLTNENENFVAGQAKDTGNITGAITLTSQDFTEIEYSLIPTNFAQAGLNYCFRVTNSGGPITYTQYASAIVSSGHPVTGEITSAVFDTGSTGAAYNSILWKGSLGAGSTGRVRFQLATSNSSSGPWTYAGGATCGSSDWFEPASPYADTPVETKCYTQLNNKRYYRYKVQICSNDCSTSGTYTPTVDDVVVSWSP